MTQIKVIVCEVYSRVVGYYRPVQAWNRGKQQEFEDRQMIDLSPALAALDAQRREEAGEEWIGE